MAFFRVVELELTNIKKIVIIGTGIMGIQISQVAALRGFDVVLKSRSEICLNIALDKIKENLKRSIYEERVTQEQANEVMARITGTTSFLEAGRDAGLIIESIVEDMKEKKRVFKEVSKACPSCTIFSSNTSSLSITELAKSVGTPQQFIGLHFLNPAAAIKLVEIVEGKDTSLELQKSRKLCRRPRQNPDSNK